jgi:hypothetical protein
MNDFEDDGEVLVLCALHVDLRYFGLAKHCGLLTDVFLVCRAAMSCHCILLEMIENQEYYCLKIVYDSLYG